MSRAKKQEPKTELEKLQSENARLRAENALLKKVKALVEEREAHECMTGRKPSKD
jgi:transposase